MTPTQISIFGAATVNLVLGFIVFRMNPQRRPNRYFLATAAMLAVWLGCLAAGSISNNRGTIIFWIRMASISSLLIPATFDLLRFSIVTPDTSARIPRRDLKVWLGVAGAAVVISHLPWFVLDVEFGDGRFPIPKYGAAQGLYVLTWLFALGFLSIQYRRGLKTAQGVERAELEFTVLGFVLACLTGVAFSQIIPLVSGITGTISLTPWAVIMFDFIVAYGIATSRIMNVGDVLRRTTAYVFLAAYLITVYLGVSTLLLAVLGWLHPNMVAVAHFTAGISVALSLVPAHGVLQRMASKLFVNFQTMDVPTALRETSELLSSIGTTENLMRRFSELATRAAGTDRVLILRRHDADVEQVFPAVNGATPHRLVREDALVKMLSDSRIPVDAASLRRMRATELTLSLTKSLSGLEAAIAVGIRSKGTMIGLLALGPRLSGRVYGAVEQDTLQLMCDQFAVALENAELYTEVQNRNIYNHILLSSLASGILAADADGKITVLNTEAERITGQASIGTVGNDVSLLPEALSDAVRETLSREVGLRDEALVIRNQGGDLVPIRLSSSIFHAHTGELLGALLVFNDMTLVRKLEEQVRRTDRLASLGTLSAGMAHEIKNPLVSIKTFTELLPERYDDQEFRETFASLLGDEVQRIDSIVNRLLKFARPAPASLEPVHLHDDLSATLQLMEQEIRRHRVELKIDLSSARDCVLGDADLLRQAFVNFVLNAIEAIEATGKEGTLTVRTMLREGHWFGEQADVDSARAHIELTLSDTGKGIAASALPRIFDPFFTTKGDGTGLGLSVSHGIIQEHGAIVDVDSTVGVGTTVRILFPLIAEEVPADTVQRAVEVRG